MKTEGRKLNSVPALHTPSSSFCLLPSAFYLLPSTFRRPRPRGFALLIVLCALIVLSLVVLSLAGRMDQAFFLTGRDLRTLDARALAFSGLQFALHPQTTPRTPALRRQNDRNHGFQARIIGEGGKLHLNWVLAGEDPVKLGVLKAYLETRGLNFEERETFVDCLLDWVSPGNTHHLNGSRTALDGSPVPGRPFQDLAEVKRVVGGETLTRQSGWEQGFTLLSRGPIDLQWADEDLLASIPGVGASRARAFVQQRRGPDKLDGTADDYPIQNVQEAAGMLGFNQQSFAAVQALLTVGDPTVRIISVGQAVDVTRTIEVVARKESAQPQILQWKEY